MRHMCEAGRGRRRSEGGSSGGRQHRCGQRWRRAPGRQLRGTHLYLAGLGLAVQAEHGGAVHLRQGGGGGQGGRLVRRASRCVPALQPASPASRHAATPPCTTTTARYLCEVHGHVQCADDAVVSVGQAVLDVVEGGVHQHAWGWGGWQVSVCVCVCGCGGGGGGGVGGGWGEHGGRCAGAGQLAVQRYSGTAVQVQKRGGPWRWLPNTQPQSPTQKNSTHACAHARTHTHIHIHPQTHTHNCAPLSSHAADLTRMVSWMVHELPSFLSATTMACLLRGGRGGRTGAVGGEARAGGGRASRLPGSAAALTH